jgi:hypothetical protein
MSLQAMSPATNPTSSECECQFNKCGGDRARRVSRFPYYPSYMGRRDRTFLRATVSYSSSPCMLMSRAASRVHIQCPACVIVAAFSAARGRPLPASNARARTVVTTPVTVKGPTYSVDAGLTGPPSVV